MAPDLGSANEGLRFSANRRPFPFSYRLRNRRISTHSLADGKVVEPSPNIMRVPRLTNTSIDVQWFVDSASNGESDLSESSQIGLAFDAHTEAYDGKS